MKTKEELLHLLATDEMIALFDALSQEHGYANDEIVLIRSQWNALRKQEMAGILDHDELQVSYAKLKQHLLHLIKSGGQSGGTGRSSLGQSAPTETLARPSGITHSMKYLLIGGLAGFLLGFIGFRLLSNQPDQSDRKLSEIENQGTTGPTAQKPPIEVKKPEPTGTTNQAIKIRPELAKKLLRTTSSSKAQFFNQTRKVTYEVLGAETEPNGKGEKLMTIKIRCTNTGSFPINFWNSTFRLNVFGTKRLLAPVGDLNEVVPERSDKEGELVFEVPDDAAKFELHIQNGDKDEKVIVLEQ